MADSSANRIETRVRVQGSEPVQDVLQASGSTLGSHRSFDPCAESGLILVHGPFGGKADLFEATLEGWFEPLIAEIRSRAALVARTAMYIRLWEAYLHVRRTARNYPFVFRIIQDNDGSSTACRNCRQQLRLAIAGFVVQGMAKGELLPGLDEDQVADEFLEFCVGPDGGPISVRHKETTARFDRFWRCIAPRSNSRSRSAN